MGILIAGLALWVLIHLFPSLAPAARQGLVSKLGNGPYQGIFSLLIIGAILLIVSGWKSATPDLIYLAPLTLRTPAMLLVVIAFILFVASVFPRTRIKRFIRHPQLSAVALWAFAHLLANGDSRSLLLFGTLGIWAVIEMVMINRRDGFWQKPQEVMPVMLEFVIPAIGIVVAVLFVRFHQWIAGVALIPG